MQNKKNVQWKQLYNLALLEGDQCNTLVTQTVVCLTSVELKNINSCLRRLISLLYFKRVLSVNLKTGEKNKMLKNIPFERLLHYVLCVCTYFTIVKI